jgi:hypothetical protein
MSSPLCGNGEEFPSQVDHAITLTGYPLAARMTQGQGEQPRVCNGALQTPGTNDVAMQLLIEGYDDNRTS